MKIMITGWLGSGITEIANLISKKEDIEVFNSNKAIRELIAERGETFQLFETESSSGTFDLDVLLRNKALEYFDEYDNLLIEGRLGLLIHDQTFDLKTFLTASREDRDKHISRQRGISIEKAKSVVQISDRDRKYVFDKMYDKPLDLTEFDLLMNTSTFGYDLVADTITQLSKIKVKN